MKNKEKYYDEIIEAFIDSHDFEDCRFKKKYVLKLNNCISIPCRTCQQLTKEWLESEYQESIKLTDDEIVILKNIDKRWEWICRNSYGGMYAYEAKPQKTTTSWSNGDCWRSCFPFDHLFQFIKWEDEPYNIDELLKQNGAER